MGAAMAQPFSQLPPNPGVSPTDFTAFVKPGGTSGLKTTVQQLFTNPLITNPTLVNPTFSGGNYVHNPLGTSVANDIPVFTDSTGLVIKDSGISISSLGGGGSVTVTDGTHTVTGATNLSFSGNAVVGGTSPNATIAITGGSSGGVSAITAGTGLSGGTITGTGTIGVIFGTTAGTVAQGNDPRFNNGSGGAVTGVITQPASGNYWSPTSVIDKLNDRVFVGKATLWDGSQSPTSGDWTYSAYAHGGVGAFAYLEQNGMFNASAPFGQLAGVFASQSSDASGGAGQYSIGVSSVVVNNNGNGAGVNTENYYGTTVRAPNATGLSTIGMELDVANLGSNVHIYPSGAGLFTTGLTANLWLAAGGELTAQTGAGYTFNPTSAAIVLLSNNPAGSGYSNVAFDKGIVFAANALQPTVPNGSAYTAIAYYVGDEMVWFNASNAVTSAVFSTNTLSTPQGGQQINISNTGTQFDDLNGNPQFEVANGISNAANYLIVTAATSGNGPVISANGSDANIGIQILPKGNGTIVVNNNVGVTCSGAPSSQFATYDGIVTHC